MKIEKNCPDGKRVNELSLVPGGVTVSVEYNTGTVIHYDKIKNVIAYVRAVNKTNVVRIFVGDKIYFQNV